MIRPADLNDLTRKARAIVEVAELVSAAAALAVAGLERSDVPADYRAAVAHLSLAGSHARQVVAYLGRCRAASVEGAANLSPQLPPPADPAA